jgi:hypothetical protein
MTGLVSSPLLYIFTLHRGKDPPPPESSLIFSSHSVWVKRHLEAGTFLFAGPKKSGLGGVILVKSIPKRELLILLAENSYVQADVVDYQIVEFDCKLAAAGCIDGRMR